MTGSFGETPQILLRHHLKKLKLPTVLREHEKLARQCATEGVDHVRYLARLIELELLDREARMIERRIKAASAMGLEPMAAPWRTPRGEEPRELRLRRPPGPEQEAGPRSRPRRVRRPTRERHRPWPQQNWQDACRLRHRPAACQRGIKTRFVTAAAVVREMIEAQDDRRLLRLQRQLAGCELLIIDEPGFVPLSKTGAELLFGLISQRRTPLRAHQPAPRARRHNHHLEPALRRVNQHLRRRAV